MFWPDYGVKMKYKGAYASRFGIDPVVIQVLMKLPLKAVF